MNKLESSYYGTASTEPLGSSEHTGGTADLNQYSVSYSHWIKERLYSNTSAYPATTANSSCTVPIFLIFRSFILFVFSLPS